jgi:hypothetical protein
MEDGILGKAFVPIILFSPSLRRAWRVLHGHSRETKVLEAILTLRPATLTGLATACHAGERAIRRDGRAGWIRAILERYRDAGILKERDHGNRVTYELVESAPEVALLRELQRVD